MWPRAVKFGATKSTSKSGKAKEYSMKTFLEIIVGIVKTLTLYALYLSLASGWAFWAIAEVLKWYGFETLATIVFVGGIVGFYGSMMFAVFRCGGPPDYVT
jgi:hypothetical protein